VEKLAKDKAEKWEESKKKAKAEKEAAEAKAKAEKKAAEAQAEKHRAAAAANAAKEQAAKDEAKKRAAEKEERRLAAAEKAACDIFLSYKQKDGSDSLGRAVYYEMKALGVDVCAPASLLPLLACCSCADRSLVPVRTPTSRCRVGQDAG
jgi:membrane protein involved in colicin uptake